MSEGSYWIDAIAAPLAGRRMPASQYNKIYVAIGRGSDSQGRELVDAITGALDNAEGPLLDALKALCDKVDGYRKTGGYPDLVLERKLLKRHDR